MSERRDGRVAEGTSLLRMRMGNCTEGSNPSLSATTSPEVDGSDTKAKYHGLYVREEVGNKGRGVFTSRDFAPGELVLVFGGALLERGAIGDVTHALQVGEDLFLTASNDLDDFVNHSCAPNCGVRLRGGRVELFALNAIPADEEITFDYAVTQSRSPDLMECACGQSSCRTLIGNFEALPSQLQDLYIAQGSYLPYVLSQRS